MHDKMNHKTEYSPQTAAKIGVSNSSNLLVGMMDGDWGPTQKPERIQHAS
jgi:hypothetical protein